MSSNFSFYLITDSHYMSKQNWVEGEPINLRVRPDNLALKYTPEILDAYIDEIINDKDIDTVIFLGDNIDNGDMNSHYEFRERLKKLTDNGQKVYMVYATHDYIGAEDDECNFQTAKRYLENGTEAIEFMRRANLPGFYYDYTQKNAVSVDKESGSYSVKLSDNILLISLIDNGNGRSYCGLFDEGISWLEARLKEAKENNTMVIVCVHHPLLPPHDLYEAIVPAEMLGGRDKLKDLFFRYDVRAVFTGHTHVQNIRKLENAEGKYLYDISTISLANPYGLMRKVSIDCESSLCKVENVFADICKYGTPDRDELYSQNFPGAYERLLPMAETDFDLFLSESKGLLPAEKLAKFRLPLKVFLGKLNKMTMYSLAKHAKVAKSLTDEEKDKAKKMKAADAVFEVLKHVFRGNGIYTPESMEYKIFHGFFVRIDKLKIKKLQTLLHGYSLASVIEGFLYNNRTGDDDNISFYLK